MCSCLDLPRDCKLAKFVTRKITATLTAISQMIVWIASILTLASPPETVLFQLQSSPTGAAMLVLAGITFSFLLIIGVLKNVRMYIQVFLVFNTVVIVVFSVSIFCSIIVQPHGFKLAKLFICILHTLLDVFAYFVIRNYYLAMISPPDERHNLAP